MSEKARAEKKKRRTEGQRQCEEKKCKAWVKMRKLSLIHED